MPHHTMPRQAQPSQTHATLHYITLRDVLTLHITRLQSPFPTLPRNRPGGGSCGGVRGGSRGGIPLIWAAGIAMLRATVASGTCLARFLAASCSSNAFFLRRTCFQAPFWRRPGRLGQPFGRSGEIFFHCFSWLSVLARARRNNAPIL